jgi:hypothetical protein
MAHLGLAETACVDALKGVPPALANAVCFAAGMDCFQFHGGAWTRPFDFYSYPMFNIHRFQKGGIA